MKNYKLAIVGATGVVGRCILKVLEEKNLPISKYVLFASSKSAGKQISFMKENYTIQELTEDSFCEGFDFAIFSAGASVAKKFAPIAVKNGCVVIDNSSAFRMDCDVPLIVPEVNSEDIKANKGIIANPNCSTIQAVVALKPLDDKYNIKRIVYSTYQAVSGINAFSTNEDYSLNKFPHPIFNNCLPHIDVFLDNGYTKEEEKMINETRKILKNPDLNVTATTVRVPVFNSHSESINVEFEKEFDLNDLINTLKNSPGIIVQNDSKSNIYPMAINSTNNNEVFVGRIRRDFSISSGVNLWVVADNIRKGAATNAIQILERMI